jgi:crooked neck
MQYVQLYHACAFEADPQLWYKYVYLEELLLNIPGARQIFERWMQWEPNDKAWQSYIKLEERYNELDRASAIYERFIGCKPVPKNWIAWSKFEEDRGQAGQSFLALVGTAKTV